MPLIRIESRPKKSTSKRPQGGREKGRPPGRRSSDSLKAVAAGGVVGLTIVAAVTGYLMSQRGTPGQAATEPTPAVEATAPQASVPSGTLPPLTSDYPREATIASVNGEPYTMGELETTVRVARVLGAFTDDEVPPDGSSELLSFMVVMLRRQVDVMLMKQAMIREGVLEPSGDVQMLIDAFLGEVGATRTELQEQMAANGVSEEDLQKWFLDARAINFYIQNTLLADRPGEDRDAVIQDWLAEQWDTQDISVRFYDPDMVLGTTPEAQGAEEEPDVGSAAPDVVATEQPTSPAQEP